jgi:hypothetical protein
MLRTTFRPKIDEMTGGWGKLHNEWLHNVYSSKNIITVIRSRGMRWTGHVACMGEKRNAYRILVAKPERKRPPRRPRGKWEDNIEIDFRKTGWGDMDWITWLSIGINGGLL